ncbi:class I SAM-dependent methyltransferase [Kordia sp. YSTF-M3]|uniref:Class I SAM-dependent methyltransferase n=1 Tax=Kordia aestuariivivens TaxID=2759037 RepID=A0ABR7Q7A0_9FLAO|nr:class I SAM-dependent methyltransferase [Kordia aestuariivivens]MBC8754313.1 class I SAM-dependent methyltransferase [Kordia aestuariivivens]
MSSPLAKDKKSLFDRMLIKLHRNASHSNRIGILSDLFMKKIDALAIEKDAIKLLDIGCGDMTITNSLAEKGNKLTCTGIDIYPNTKNWEHYMEFDGKTLPFENKSYDVVLFSDVLHHDYEHMHQLIKEAKRVADFIVIKDHFEYGFFSRSLLQLADIVGNYGYGVSIPKHYFTKQRFYTVLKENQLEEIETMCPVHLYNHIPLVKWIFKGKYQFISTIRA